MSWSIRKVPRLNEWIFHVHLENAYNIKVRLIEGAYRYDQYGAPALYSVGPSRWDRESIVLEGNDLNFNLTEKGLYPNFVITLPEESADALYNYITEINQRSHITDTYNFRNRNYNGNNNNNEDPNQLTEATYVYTPSNTIREMNNASIRNTEENNNPIRNTEENNNPKPLGGRRKYKKYKTRKIRR